MFLFLPAQKQWIPPYVKDYPWELQNEIAKILNPPKQPIGNDWRLVASRLGFDVDFIETIKKEDSPTLTLLKNCTETTTHTFLGILSDSKVRRMDVIHAMTECVNNSPGIRERSPTQESVASVGWSSPSNSFDKGPFERYPSQELDSGIERCDNKLFAYYLHTGTGICTSYLGFCGAAVPDGGGGGLIIPCPHTIISKL